VNVFEAEPTNHSYYADPERRSQHEIHRKTGIDRKTIRKYAAVAANGRAGNFKIPPWPPARR